MVLGRALRARIPRGTATNPARAPAEYSIRAEGAAEHGGRAAEGAAENVGLTVKVARHLRLFTCPEEEVS